MILGGHNNDIICYCDIIQNSNQTKYEWKLHELKMPHCVDDDDYDILLFDNLIFIFYFPLSWYFDIWCLDVIISNKLYKSVHEIDDYITGDGRNVYIMKGNDNFIHILDFCDKQNVKICLYDLIPNDVVKLYSNYYKLLVIGYISEKENDNTIPTIPYVVKKLIYKYFPLFI